MNAIDSAKLLNELRSMSAQARGMEMRGTELRGAGMDSLSKTNGVASNTAGVQPFSQLMTRALNQVNETQLQASELQHRVDMGDRSVSLVQAMIASQKANIGLQATIQVRNRLVSAYQDVFNMPI